MITKAVIGSGLSVLLLAWVVAALVRVATGSATVATVTAAGLLTPIAATLPQTDVALMVLAIGSGSLFLSHVNDAGFWLVKQYLGTDVPQTFKTWSVMECLISVTGLLGVLLLSAISVSVSYALSPPTVLVVMGVSGTGKSTVAGLLAGHLGWPLEEGDDLHPEANVDKMEQGIPLTDDDRWPWLDRIGEWIDAQGRANEPGIVTCSALKRSYRDRLRRPNVVFVHLSGSRETIRRRMARREDHFMPLSLLDSQLDTLETPGPDEQVITVDLGGTPQDEVAVVLHELGRP